METLELMLKAVTENPDDANAAAVAYDAAQEAGSKPLTARKKVNAAKRAGRVRQAEQLVEKHSAIRTRCREAAGVGGTPPVVVLEGDAAPYRIGEEAYYTFKNGGRITYPGAARRHGYKMDYHRSTLEICVGAEWVLNNI